MYATEPENDSILTTTSIDPVFMFSGWEVTIMLPQRNLSLYNYNPAKFIGYAPLLDSSKLLVQLPGHRANLAPIVL